MSTQDKSEQKNCVSVVLSWPKEYLKKNGEKRPWDSDLMRDVLSSISLCAEEGKVFKSQSTISGFHSSRLDVVFNAETEARKFNSSAKLIKLPPKLDRRTYLFSETELGFNQEPVLTEADVLHIAKFDEHKHIFRNFHACSVIPKDGKILFRFNSLADVNLLLYNKCRDPVQRVLGMFRQHARQLYLVPDEEGMFSLMVNNMGKKGDQWSLKKWEKKFKYKPKLFGQGMCFLFERKVDLYTFFASEEARGCGSVELPQARINSKKEKSEVVANKTNNCLSMILVWQKDNYKKSNKQQIRDTMGEVLKDVTKIAGEVIVFESQSTLVGNQARLDMVLETEKEARRVNNSVKESLKLPPKLSCKTFLFSEAELEYRQEPVLTEMDVLNIVKFDKLSHLFRHFLSCSVVNSKDRIMFRFNSLADLNLFLYNKCRDPSKRVLGRFRQSQEQLCLLPDPVTGRFSLCVHPDNTDSMWVDKFKYTKKKDGSNVYFLFDNKLDLYTFFASEEAKEFCESVEIPGDQLGSLEQQQLAEEEAAKDKLLAIEKELIAAKLELARKEKVFENQRIIISKLKTELNVKLRKRSRRNDQ